MGRGHVNCAVFIVLAGLLTLGGCAETALTVNAAKSLTDGTSNPAQNGRYKIGSAYEVGGRWYTPHEDYEYEEVGMASWYGPNFHGRSTANGERFDQNALTAAHRTLPMPSLVRVTNLENGRTIDLRVNDRGPFSNDRILDVSKKAAEVLGFRRQGTARVRVVILSDESLAMRDGLEPPRRLPSGGVQVASTTTGAAFVAPSMGLDTPRVGPFRLGPVAIPVSAPARAIVAAHPSAGTGPAGWYVQAGAFSDSDNAHRVASHLSGVGPTRVSSVLRNGREMVRVRVGPAPDGRAAARLLQAVQASGYPDARLVAN